MNFILVSQAFGRESEYKRAIFMVWSLWSRSETPAKVLMFTDDPNYFTPFFQGQPVQFVTLTAEKIRVMRGPHDFLHHMKIAMIEEAFQLSHLPLLYADSDTFFLADPSPVMSRVSERQAFMHLREYAFEEIRDMELPAGKTFREFVSLIENRLFDLPDGRRLRITADQYSWNAGVMMLHPSLRKLLPEVYALTNQFYPATGNHASEQYAFSIALQNYSDLQPCDDVIYHYWYRVKKQVMDMFLEQNLNLKWAHLPIERKRVLIKGWTIRLVDAFENHPLIVRDKSIQSFHQGKKKAGFQHAIKYIIRRPTDLKFYHDLIYHTRKLFFNG